MSESEQVRHFGDELDKLVDRFAKEHDMTYAAMVGTLQMKSYILCQQAADREDEVQS